MKVAFSVELGMLLSLLKLENNLGFSMVATWRDGYLHKIANELSVEKPDENDFCVSWSHSCSRTKRLS